MIKLKKFEKYFCLGGCEKLKKKTVIFVAIGGLGVQMNHLLSVLIVVLSFIHKSNY
jgi:hypothetical protein